MEDFKEEMEMEAQMERKALRREREADEEAEFVQMPAEITRFGRIGNAQKIINWIITGNTEGRTHIGSNKNEF